MPTPLSCIIVDDDEIDRLTTLSFARRFPELNIRGVFPDAEHTLAWLQQNEMPDILFLDIDMPGMSGLALREHLRQAAACVFITAHPDYAVESFDLEALDFLVKPLKFERFHRAMDRIQTYFSLRNKAALFDNAIGADTIFIKDGHEQVKVQLRDIVYLQALKDYTCLHTGSKKHYVLSSIGNLLQEAAFAQSFIRIHKSYAVQKHYVEKMTATEVFASGVPLPVGRSFKETLAQYFSTRKI